MNFRKILIMLAIFSIVVVLLPGCAAVPGVSFDNQTDQEVSVFMTFMQNNDSDSEYTELGSIPANEKVKFLITFPDDNTIMQIQIRDTSRMVIFKGEYTRTDLKNNDWTITIK